MYIAKEIDIDSGATISELLVKTLREAEFLVMHSEKYIIIRIGRYDGKVKVVKSKGY